MSNLLKKLTPQERDNLSITEMKEILQQAITLKDEDNKFNRIITSNTMKILSIAGKEELYDLVPEMFELLNSWNSFFRQLSVSNLGFWLRISEFKDMAYEIFINDQDDSVQFSALLSWTAYYANTRDSIVLEQLYKILINDNYDESIKSVSLDGIFEVIGIKPKFYDIGTSKFMRCQTPEEFNSKVDWQEVTYLLKKYAPNALKHYPIKRNNGSAVN